MYTTFSNQCNLDFVLDEICNEQSVKRKQLGKIFQTRVTHFRFLHQEMNIPLLQALKYTIKQSKCFMIFVMSGHRIIRMDSTSLYIIVLLTETILLSTAANFCLIYHNFWTNLTIFILYVDSFLVV